MITKESLKNLKKVTIWVSGIKGNNFKSGQKSKTFRVYDVTPDEVFEIIKKAVIQKAE